MNVYDSIAAKRLDCDRLQYRNMQYNTKLAKRYIKRLIGRIDD